MIASFNQGYDEARFIVDEINDNITKGHGIFGDFAISVSNQCPVASV